MIAELKLTAVRKPLPGRCVDRRQFGCMLRSFYRKIGNEEEARIREFYSAGVDKIVFRKALG